MWVQIAAYANWYLMVYRISDGYITASEVVTVENENWHVEPARMLGGVSDSSAVHEHACEFLLVIIQKLCIPTFFDV